MDTRPSNRSYFNDPSIAQPIDYMVPGAGIEPA